MHGHEYNSRVRSPQLSKDGSAEIRWIDGSQDRHLISKMNIRRHVMAEALMRPLVVAEIESEAGKPAHG